MINKHETLGIIGSNGAGRSTLIKTIVGLMPIMVNTCFEVIKKLNDRGITIPVVKQNANKALKVADRGYVPETGNIIISDTAENTRRDDTVQKAYLGG